MWNVLIPVLGAVLVALIASAATVAAQVINSRNDRAQAHQEVDLLRKLDPTSDSAKELAQVVQARIGRWHQRFYKNTPKLRGIRRAAHVFPETIVLVATGAFVLAFLGLLYSYASLGR